MIICIDIRDVIIGKLLHIRTIRIHGIESVVVGRITEENSAVAFTEKSAIIKITGRISIDVTGIHFCAVEKMNQTKNCNQNKNNCNRDKELFFLFVFHKNPPSNSGINLFF